MASSIFRVSRTETEGQQSGPATLNKAQEPVKMRVYEDESDVDLSEIGDKEIFAVEEENDLANVYVTDLVQEGNMNPITSNAVARFTGANYSTDEVKTSNTWIDGKPIYRKVILNPTLDTTLLTGVDEVVNYRVKRQCYSGTPQGYVYFDGDSVTTVNTTIYIDLANNEVKLKSLHSGAYFNVQWAILEYTKTTD